MPITLNVKFFFQFVRDLTVTVLGQFRVGGSDSFRLDGDQKFHPVLGSAPVRILFGDQYYCPSQHADCYDVQLVSNNFGK